MKRMIGVAVLAMLWAAVAPGDEPDQGEEHPLLEEIELRERQMDLEQRECKMEHERKLAEMELEERRVEIDRMRGEERGDDIDPGGGVLVLLVLVTNILLTVWVCKDMQEQKIGRALWVPIVLLTGVFGAILYAIVRNTDTRAKPAK